MKKSAYKKIEEKLISLVSKNKYVHNLARFIGFYIYTIFIFPKYFILCGFDVKELKSLGFKVYGSAGLKILYNGQKNNKNEIIWIRRPVFFWTIIAEISRCFTYCLPNYAFELYGVRNKK